MLMSINVTEDDTEEHGAISQHFLYKKFCGVLTVISDERITVNVKRGNSLRDEMHSACRFMSV